MGVYDGPDRTRARGHLILLSSFGANVKSRDLLFSDACFSYGRCAASECERGKAGIAKKLL
jgi:hypothetical protein